MPELNRDLESLAYCASDRRADGGVRTIRLSQRGVRIERTVSGVKIRVAVPIEAYRGVVLSYEDKLDRRFCLIGLAHADPDLSVALHYAAEGPAILTLWQNWARYFAKPALYAANPALSEKTAATTRPRRRNAAQAKRTTRVLLRRRQKRLDPTLKVFSAVNELFSRE